MAETVAQIKTSQHVSVRDVKGNDDFQDTKIIFHRPF